MKHLVIALLLLLAICTQGPAYAQGTSATASSGETLRAWCAEESELLPLCVGLTMGVIAAYQDIGLDFHCAPTDFNPLGFIPVVRAWIDENPSFTQSMSASMVVFSAVREEFPQTPKRIPHVSGDPDKVILATLCENGRLGMFYLEDYLQFYLALPVDYPMREIWLSDFT